MWQYEYFCASYASLVSDQGPLSCLWVEHIVYEHGIFSIVKCPYIFSNEPKAWQFKALLSPAPVFCYKLLLQAPAKKRFMELQVMCRSTFLYCYLKIEDWCWKMSLISGAHIQNTASLLSGETHCSLQMGFVGALLRWVAQSFHPISGCIIKTKIKLLLPYNWL